MSFLPKRHVIVPIDFSEASLKAARLARSLVDDPTHLHLIHVLPLLTPMDPGVVWGAWNDETRKSHAAEALQERLAPELRGATVEVRIGDPGRDIPARAAEVGADLIVLPSHGRTGAARLFIGSVAERVVRHAHCPVLVLRD